MSPDGLLPHVDMGSGNPVLLLHGFGLDARMWSAQIDALRGSHRVIAPDLPGFGPRGATAGRWSPSAEVLRLIETKQLGPVHLVGLSFGGAIAIDFLLSAPAVRSLVLIDARLLGEQTGLATWTTAVELAKAGDLPGARQAWLESEAFSHLGPEARELTRAMVHDYPCGHWRGTVETVWHQPEPRPHLPMVRTPALVLTGERDLPEFRAMARIYAEAIPGARLVELQGVGHMGPMEAPDRVNALLTSFIASQDAPGRRVPASARLAFRTWRDDEQELAMQLWGDARVTALVSRQPFDRSAVEARLRLEVRLEKDHGFQYWPVFLRETGELVGCCGLHPRAGEEGVVELGFHLRPQFWGQGFASEAARAVVQYAFETLWVKGVFAGHHPENEASRRVLERLGFRYTHHELYPPTGLEHPAYLLLPGELRAARSEAGERFGER
jgi:RimJ/RimL family protein N-acetyltransferase/pimeloyl-ACP methyl ester carboxylesterase